MNLLKANSCLIFSESKRKFIIRENLKKNKRNSVRKVGKEHIAKEGKKNLAQL